MARFVDQKDVHEEDHPGAEGILERVRGLGTRYDTGQRLSQSWTFWLHDREAGQYIELGTFSMHLGYRNIYEAVLRGYEDEFPVGYELCMFRKGIHPAPDALENSQGGSWSPSSGEGTRGAVLSVLFPTLTLGLLGGKLVHDCSSHTALGVVYRRDSDRDVVELWDDGGLAAGDPHAELVTPDESFGTQVQALIREQCGPDAPVSVWKYHEREYDPQAAAQAQLWRPRRQLAARPPPSAGDRRGDRGGPPQDQEEQRRPGGLAFGSVREERRRQQEDEARRAQEPPLRREQPPAPEEEEEGEFDDMNDATLREQIKEQGSGLRPLFGVARAGPGKPRRPSGKGDFFRRAEGGRGEAELPSRDAFGGARRRADDAPRPRDAPPAAPRREPAPAPQRGGERRDGRPAQQSAPVSAPVVRQAAPIPLATRNVWRQKEEDEAARRAQREAERRAAEEEEAAAREEEEARIALREELAPDLKRLKKVSAALDNFRRQKQRLEAGKDIDDPDEPTPAPTSWADDEDGQTASDEAAMLIRRADRPGLTSSELRSLAEQVRGMIAAQHQDVLQTREEVCDLLTERERQKMLAERAAEIEKRQQQALEARRRREAAAALARMNVQVQARKRMQERAQPAEEEAEDEPEVEEEEVANREDDGAPAGGRDDWEQEDAAGADWAAARDPESEPEPEEPPTGGWAREDIPAAVLQGRPKAPPQQPQQQQRPPQRPAPAAQPPGQRHPPQSGRPPLQQPGSAAPAPRPPPQPQQPPPPPQQPPQQPPPQRKSKSKGVSDRTVEEAPVDTNALVIRQRLEEQRREQRKKLDRERKKEEAEQKKLAKQRMKVGDAEGAARRGLEAEHQGGLAPIEEERMADAAAARERQEGREREAERRRRLDEADFQLRTCQRREVLDREAMERDEGHAARIFAREKTRLQQLLRSEQEAERRRQEAERQKEQERKAQEAKAKREEEARKRKEERARKQQEELSQRQKVVPLESLGHKTIFSAVSEVDDEDEGADEKRQKKRAQQQQQQQQPKEGKEKKKGAKTAGSPLGGEPERGAEESKAPKESKPPAEPAASPKAAKKPKEQKAKPAAGSPARDAPPAADSGWTAVVDRRKKDAPAPAPIPAPAPVTSAEKPKPKAAAPAGEGSGEEGERRRRNRLSKKERAAAAALEAEHAARLQEKEKSKEKKKQWKEQRRRERPSQRTAEEEELLAVATEPDARPEPRNVVEEIWFDITDFTQRVTGDNRLVAGLLGTLVFALVCAVVVLHLSS